VTSWTCYRCPSTATRSAWGEKWCERCHALVTTPIRAREHATTDDDYGHTLHPFAGIARDPHYNTELQTYVVTCDTCGAGSWSTNGEPEWCWYCHRSYLRLIDDQIDTLLTPPDIDPAAQGHDTVMGAWFDRLLRGVANELITREQASAAWARSRRGLAA
jgi:hypothetical protein